MVSTSTKRKVGTASPTTRCTNCQTVFELPPELLESSDTRVRCGECLCIFDAREGLLNDSDAEKSQQAQSALDSDEDSQLESAIAGNKKRTRSAHLNKSAADDNSALDVTYSDFDLFSEEADLPALAYLDETRDTPEFDFDAVELGDEETFSDTLFAHDVTINADLPIPDSQAADEGLTADSLARLQRAEVDFAVDKAPEEPLIFNYVDPPGDPIEVSEEATETEAPLRHSSTESMRNNAAEKAERARSKHNRPSLASLEEESSLVDTDAASSEPKLDTEAPTRARSGLWVWACGILLLLGVLGATVLYPRWQSLDQSPNFRPVKVAVCQLLKCRVDTRVDINQLKVLRREVTEARDREDALLISIDIQNTAEFAQRYPVVEVRMTDRVGRTVAQRAFRPTEYLSEWRRGDALNAGETVDIKLVVNDPGAAARDHILQLRKLRFDCEPIKSNNGQQRWPADCADVVK